jgi:hypothetical protein
MSTDGNTTPPPAPQPSGPANPARGSNQGQKTLAAKIGRWKRLGTNLALHIDQLPLFKDQFSQFQGMLAAAQSLTSQLDAARANTADLMAQRTQMVTDGDDLYNRLSLALRAVHGPAAGRLREFGLKPHRLGRPKKTTATTPSSPEAPTASAGGNPASK